MEQKKNHKFAQNNLLKPDDIKRLIRGQLGLNKSTDAIKYYMQDKGVSSETVDLYLESLRKEIKRGNVKAGLGIFVFGLVLTLAGTTFWGWTTHSRPSYGGGYYETHYYWYGAFLVGIPCTIYGIYCMLQKH